MKQYYGPHNPKLHRFNKTRRKKVVLMKPEPDADSWRRLAISINNAVYAGQKVLPIIEKLNKWQKRRERLHRRRVLAKRQFYGCT